MLKQRLSFRHKILLFVLLPTLLAAFYYSFWASDMYLSETGFSLRGPEGGGTSDLLAIFGQGGGSTTADAYVVQAYSRSMDLLKTLDEQLLLRQHYQSKEADIFSRLPADASDEEFHAYFKKVVTVMFDPATGIFTLTTRAYSPEMAQNLGQAITDASEKLVNQLRERALNDSLGLARGELSHAEKKLAEVRGALKLFRQESESINPEASAKALFVLVTELETEAVKARTQLAETRSFMRDDSAQVIAVKARISALAGQIKEEKARLTGVDRRVMSEVVADYERLVVEREFAEKLYLSALAALEGARIRAEGKSRYLVAFSPPTLPDEALWPRRLSSTGLVSVGASLLFGIISLVVAAIREHAGF